MVWEPTQCRSVWLLTHSLMATLQMLTLAAVVNGLALALLLR